MLGGGGIAGYAFHCAALTALERETGFDPRTAEIIVGTSAGAICGAIVRGDVPTTELSRRLLESATSPGEMDTLQMISGRAPRAVPKLWTGPGAPRMAVSEIRRGRNIRLSRLVAALLPQGRQRLTPITEPLDELHHAGWPAKAFWVPATELESGELTVFGRDVLPPEPPDATVARAVEASAALPVFFSPVVIDGRSYIDGGIGSPFNVDLLTDYRSADNKALDLLLVSAPLSLNELRTDTPISSITRSLPRRRLRSELRQIADGGTETMVIEPDQAVAAAMGLNPMDHRSAPAIMVNTEELIHRQLSALSPTARAALERAATLPSPADSAYPAAL